MSCLNTSLSLCLECTNFNVYCLKLEVVKDQWINEKIKYSYVVFDDLC